MSKYCKVFGKNLRKYRKLKGLSQEKLAELLCIGSKSISPVECGYRSFSFKLIEKVSEVLEIEPYQLFITDSGDVEVSDDMKRNQILKRLERCDREKLDAFYDVLYILLDK